MSVHLFKQLVAENLSGFSPKTIFEVGSRDGNDAALFCDSYSEATVHCFEPNPATLQMCREVASSRPRMIIVPQAVSDEDGPILFYQSTTENQGYSSIYRPSGLYDHVEPMPTQAIAVMSTRLDSYIERTGCPPPDMLWMDCQGAELQVMKSLGVYLKSVRAIWTEIMFNEIYRDQPMRGQIVSFLSENGFRQVHEQVVLRDIYGVPWWGDGAFVRERIEGAQD